MNKTGEFYIVVEALRSGYVGTIYKLKGVNVSQHKPGKLLKDQIAVKIKIEVPEEAFEPYTPTASLVVTTPLLKEPKVEAVGTVRISETAERLRELLEDE